MLANLGVWACWQMAEGDWQIRQFLYQNFTVSSNGLFLALYLGGGAVSSFCQAAWPYVIPRSWPASRNYSTSSPGLGASGGVNAVVMFNILSFPATTVLLWGILPIPGIMFGLGYIGIDAYNLYMGDGQVGNAAHLAGAAVGGSFVLVAQEIGAIPSLICMQCI
eukprot:gene26108-32639_t